MKTKSVRILFFILLACATSQTLPAQQKGMANTVNDIKDIVTRLLSRSIEKKEVTIIVDQVIFTDHIFNPQGNMVYLDDLEGDMAPTGDEKSGTIKMSPAPFFLVLQGDSVGINLPYTRIPEQTLTKTVDYEMKKSKKGKYTLTFSIELGRVDFYFKIQINPAGKVKLVITDKDDRQPYTFYGNASFPMKQKKPQTES